MQTAWSRVRYPLMVFTFAAFFLLCGGCADSGNSGGPTTRPLTMQEKQDAALRDPFGYGGNIEKTDITGGGLGNYDKKAMKRDLDSVLNP